MNKYCIGVAKCEAMSIAEEEASGEVQKSGFFAGRLVLLLDISDDIRRRLLLLLLSLMHFALLPFYRDKGGGDQRENPRSRLSIIKIFSKCFFYNIKQSNNSHATPAKQ